MKNILPIVLLLFAGATGYAQEILLEETFDDGTLGVFTGYSVIGDGQEWTADSFMDDQFAEMNGFDGGIQDNEDWLISPALNMDAYEDEVLTFQNACNFDGPNLEVLASNDYDGSSDPNTATWTDLSGQATFSQGDYEYVNSGAIDLSAVTGTGYIAFKYISNASVDGKLWQVDSVVVSAGVPSSRSEARSELISAPRVQNGVLQFTSVQPMQPLEAALHSLDGRRVLQTALTQPGTVRIPVRHLPKGAYILAVRATGAARGYKVLIW